MTSLAARSGCWTRDPRPVKSDTADAVVAPLEPVRQRYAALVADRQGVDKLLGAVRDRAAAFGAPRLEAAMRATALMS
jgi:hypothetical protein